jgi:hypothetical protein
MSSLVIALMAHFYATVTAAQQINFTAVATVESDTQKGILLAQSYAAKETEKTYASVAAMTGDMVMVEVIQLETSTPLPIAEITAKMYGLGYRPATLWECLPIHEDLIKGGVDEATKQIIEPKAVSVIGTIGGLTWREKTPGIADGTVFLLTLKNTVKEVSRKDTLWRSGERFAVVRLPDRSKKS